MTIFICASLALIAACALVGPHLYHYRTPVVASARGNFAVAGMEDPEEVVWAELLEARDRILLEFQDLEIDRQAGRLSDQEHTDLRDELEVELAQILAELDLRKGYSTADLTASTSVHAKSVDRPHGEQ